MAGAAAGVVIFMAGAAAAQDAPIATAQAQTPAPPLDPREAKIQQLESEVQELAAQIGDLKAEMSSGLKDVRATQAAQTKVTIANGKPQIASADGKFTANLHGVMQFDAAHYFQGTVPAAQVDPHAQNLNSGTNFRRARIGIDGKAFSDFNYNVLLDFGGTAGGEDAGKVQELWVEYTGFHPFRVKVGAFPPLLGLEDANSTNGQPFLERPAASDATRSLAGGDRREAVQLAANGDHWLVAGSVTGNTVSSLSSVAAGFNAQNYDEQVGLTGRAAISPIHGADYLVHLGVHGQVVTQPADAGPAAATRYGLTLSATPELTVDGTKLISTGAINSTGAHEWGLEAGAQFKSFYVQGEYFNEGFDRLNPAAGVTNPHFTGWYVEGSWFLTGETRRYNPATAAWDAPGSIRHPLDPKGGGAGAFEVALRYSDLDLNYHTLSAVAGDAVRGGDQKIFAVGLNWYPNTFARFMVDYQHVKVERINSALLEIGQAYDTIGVRSQFAF